jgi:hypothetical protein
MDHGLATNRFKCCCKYWVFRQELAYLQSLFGTVNPGRYWLNGWGIGGYESGPPLFNNHI